MADDGRWRDGAGLRWLFLDLNSYFASAEQQMRPELRGRPVIVVPVDSDFTCAIAASIQAKTFGIRTGTGVREAKALCPDLLVVNARPDVYVELHQKIMAEIDRHIPVWKVCSIDECVCRLAGPEQLQDNAVDLARRVQAGVRANVGECLRSSVGLAPSRFLAKTASGMQKPDGLVVLREDELPGPLLDLPLKTFPGVGPRMVKRLAAAGVHDTASLWNLTASRARQIWGSIEGERLWYALHGVDSEQVVNKQASISHSHVLAPELRTPEKARLVARRLAVKCGMRLRRMGLTGGGLHLILDLQDHRSATLERRFPQTADTFVFLKAVDEMWDALAPQLRSKRLRYVGMAVVRIGEADAGAPDLFGWTPGQEADPRKLRLCQALDSLNRKYGKDTISIGELPDLPDFVGAKIAFNRIPEKAEFAE
ncbi:MAG: Y-family DNA polymerase [Caulobacteraceae bacterium]